MKNDKKNIITEISRIQEIMYGKSIISEGKITRFADDLADFIKTFKTTTKYTSPASTDFAKYVDELDGILLSNDINKEKRIIELLNSERTNSQLSSFIDDVEDTIYKSMCENPTEKQIKAEVETFKNQKNPDGTSTSDEMVDDYINQRTEPIKDNVGTELYVRKLKEEFGIKVDTPTVSTSTTRKLSDDELLIKSKQEAAAEVASIENKANTESAKVVDAATEEQVRNALEDFLKYMESTFTAVKIPNKKVLGFFKSTNYEFFIKQLRQQLTKGLSDIEKAIDSIPQSKIDEFNNMNDKDKLKVLDEVMGIMKRAKSSTPLDRIGAAGKFAYKAYDIFSLNFLFKKLNWVTQGTDLTKFSLRRSLRLILVKTVVMEAFNIAQNFMEYTMVLTSDEDFSFDMRIHDMIDLDPDVEFFTTPYIQNSLLNWAGRTLGFGWNTAAGVVNTIDWLVSTSGEGSKMGEGKPEVKIQYLERGNVINSVITQEESKRLTDFYKSLFGDSYDESASSTFNFWSILTNSLTIDDKIQLIAGTPISGGLNQIREDKEGNLLYIGKTGVFKITEDGPDSYIKALNSSGQVEEIKIKDIFEDKYNRYLGEYDVIPGTEIQLEEYVEFWPTRIEFDNKVNADSELATQLKNAYGLLVGIGLDEDYNKVKQYLYGKNIVIPPNNIQKYSYYPKTSVDELNPPDNNIDPLKRKYKIPESGKLGDFLYIVSRDGKVYRIFVAKQSNASKRVTNGGSDNTYIKKDNIYATDGTNWYPLEYVANMAIEQNDTKTTTSTNENLSPKEQFEKDNPNTKLTLIAAIGDLAVYKDSDNKRYRLFEGKIEEVK